MATTKNHHGITIDYSASDYLREKIGCRDPRIGKNNVMRLYYPSFDFERIFVFYDIAEGQYQLGADQLSGSRHLIEDKKRREMILQKGMKSG